MGLVHHELCFGCGTANLFGLLLELERTGPERAGGRCFIKQDHQGADRGQAHDGVIAAALSESMALLCGGPDAHARSLTVTHLGRAPVGTFLELAVEVLGRDDTTLRARASATSLEGVVARAEGTFAHGLGDSPRGYA